MYITDSNCQSYNVTTLPGCLLQRGVFPGSPSLAQPPIRGKCAGAPGEWRMGWMKWASRHKWERNNDARWVSNVRRGSWQAWRSTAMTLFILNIYYAKDSWLEIWQITSMTNIDRISEGSYPTVHSVDTVQSSTYSATSDFTPQEPTSVPCCWCIDLLFSKASTSDHFRPMQQV